MGYKNLKVIVRWNVILFFSFYPILLSAQEQNVSIQNPVYRFLKRMEVLGHISDYRDAVLPLSRKEIASFLSSLSEHRENLSVVDQECLLDYLKEFNYDIEKSLSDESNLFGGSKKDYTLLDRLVGEQEKFLYSYVDDVTTLFIDGLLKCDIRRRWGDELDGQRAEYVQIGGRIQGTLYKNLGYYIEGTNAQFWGSRDLLQKDKIISQSFAVRTPNSKNFDFVEGYVRYGGDVLSVQLGRERIFWGNGYGDKLILSDSVRVFEFIRTDVKYKAIQYQFIHAWLLGLPSRIKYVLPSDTTTFFEEPITADKYFAGHRLGISFPNFIEIGFQEMVIYSYRAPDLAYLNPITLIETAQRSREERDNVAWALDFQLHPLNGVEVQASMLFDDIHFDKVFKDRWENKFAYQVGTLIADPLSIPNTVLGVEYTRIDPYVYSHGRSRENYFGSLGKILGHHIGPNAESWYFRFEYYFSRKLKNIFQYEIRREGDNIYDDQGNLIKNVGGDILQPHREKDPLTKNFLDGLDIRTRWFETLISYEIVNEVFFDIRLQYLSRLNRTMNCRSSNYDAELSLRFDF